MWQCVAILPCLEQCVQRVDKMHVHALLFLVNVRKGEGVLFIWPHLTHFRCSKMMYVR